MISHEYMMALTADMPMKQIDVNGPYLQRYYGGTLGDGCDIWLHRFMSADGDRHLHNHPFEALSIPLVGGYTEDSDQSQVRWYAGAGSFARLPSYALIGLTATHTDHLRLDSYRQYGRIISPFYWHRIATIEPGTWTLMIVRPERLPYWYFSDGKGNLEEVKSSPRDWWQNYEPRPSIK